MTILCTRAGADTSLQHLKDDILLN